MQKKLLSVLLVAVLAMPITAQAGPLTWLFGKKKEADPVTQITVETNSGNDVLVELSGSQFLDLQKSVDDRQARETCYQNLNTAGMDSHAQVLREVGNLLGKGIDCGPNNADVAIARENRKLGQTQARWAGFGDVTKTLVGGATKITLADKIGDAVIAGVSKPSNQTTVSDNSTYQGAQGNGASYNETRTEVADSDIEEGEEPISDFDACIAAGGDPVNTDGNVMVSADDGVFDRCSDGAGGTL